MAEYLTRFSCLLPVRTAANAERALAIHAAMKAEREAADEAIGFVAALAQDHADAVWLTDTDGAGDPEQVIAFVLRCAAALDLRGIWGFCWALTCSQPRFDGFGGGAHRIDLGGRKTLAWIDCEHWLACAAAPDPFDRHEQPVRVRDHRSVSGAGRGAASRRARGRGGWGRE